MCCNYTFILFPEVWCSRWLYDAAVCLQQHLQVIFANLVGINFTVIIIIVCSTLKLYHNQYKHLLFYIFLKNNFRHRLER